MDDKSKLELYEQLDKHKKEEMDRSDKTYARKIAETLIFGFVGMALVAIVGALLKLVVFTQR